MKPIPATEESKRWNLEAFRRSTKALGGSVAQEDETEDRRPLYGFLHAELKADCRLFESEVMAHNALHEALRDHLNEQYPIQGVEIVRAA